MTRSPFVVPIGDLLRDRAEPRDVDIEAAVDWHVELSGVLADPPLTATLTLAPMPGGLLVRGSVQGTAQHSCHRCLGRYEAGFDVSVAELFLRPDEASEDDYVLEGDQLDLEPLLRDDVLLAMPLLPTCPDCGELVDTSQSDLNTDVPEADDSRSPFAVLKDLFEPGQSS